LGLLLLGLIHLLEATMIIVELEHVFDAVFVEKVASEIFVLRKFILQHSLERFIG
jgi:hypothetical protein